MISVVVGVRIKVELAILQNSCSFFSGKPTLQFLGRLIFSHEKINIRSLRLEQLILLKKFPITVQNTSSWNCSANGHYNSSDDISRTAQFLFFFPEKVQFFQNSSFVPFFTRFFSLSRIERKV